jgi:hypothetical protein
LVNKDETIKTLAKLLSLSDDDIDRINRETESKRKGSNLCKLPTVWIMNALPPSASACPTFPASARARAIRAFTRAAQRSAI